MSHEREETVRKKPLRRNCLKAPKKKLFRAAPLNIRNAFSFEHRPCCQMKCHTICITFTLPIDVEIPGSCEQSRSVILALR